MNRSATVARAYLLAGISYPVWSLLAPAPSDPLAVWLGIGGAFLVAAAVVVRWDLSHTALANVTVVLGSIVTLHFFLLAAMNDMRPFYAVGSSMSVLATVLIVRSLPAMLAYGGFVGVLAGVLYTAEPDARKLAYWVSPLPTVIFAYHRLGAQLALEQRLEYEVAERTRQLSETNQRLRDEIQTRQRLEEALQVQQKVEAVGRLAGGVAHDFNNLLMTIGVYAELLSDGLPEGSPLRAEVDRIQQAQRQAASLTQQLLTLGSRSHVRLSVLDLDEFVSDLFSLLQRVLGGHELVFALGAGKHPISGNADQLRQVVLNLALNARDAMTEPGRLTIETARCARDDLAKRLGVELDNAAYVLLAVTDTGSGMSAETRRRAFDPFFSTKPPDRGSGLGLAVVHGIVSQAGGHVRLRSEPGQGARFELYWPLAAWPRPSERSSTLLPAERARPASILLVEDEEPVRTALHRVLTSAGYLVAEAGDGEQALAILQDAETHFDLVIADVVMKRVSGFDLAEQLAETRPGAKVLLISGYLNDRSQSDVDGSFAFLAKPFTPQDLDDKVREVLGYSRGLAGEVASSGPERSRLS